MDAAQKGRRSKGQWTEERSENLANLWNAIELEMGEHGRMTKTAIAAAIVAKGGLFSECSADSLMQQVKTGRAGNT